MKTETKILTLILGVTIFLILGGIFFISKTSPKTTTTDSGETVFQIDYSKGRKVGSDSATVRLVEFSDFQCPACKAAQPTVEEIINANKSNAGFQFVYRNYPLAQHQNARAAANAAEAAGEQNKYWEMHNKLFETQEKWANLSNPADFFAGLSKELGLDDAKIKDAVIKGAYNDKIQSDINDGNAAAVNATPTFYLNGKKLQMASFQELKDQVQASLGK